MLMWFLFRHPPLSTTQWAFPQLFDGGSPGLGPAAPRGAVALPRAILHQGQVLLRDRALHLQYIGLGDSGHWPRGLTVCRVCGFPETGFHSILL